MKKYPDVSGLLRAKEEHRKEVARRPITEKLEMATKLRDATRLIKSSRRIDFK